MMRLNRPFVFAAATALVTVIALCACGCSSGSSSSASSGATSGSSISAASTSTGTSSSSAVSSASASVGASSSSAASAASSSSSASGDATSISAQDQAIVDELVENFKQLAAVPRPSHHEEKISNFLKDWAEGLGFAVIQDEALNIVFDIPATSGYENLPLVILQGHMDMVCVAEEGKTFDPLTDPITVVNDGKTLTADGTSLGADDGSGVAVIMAIAKGAMDHGPLRVLITTDEEDGMEGAFALDSTHLQDAKYLINIDNEDSRSILVSTAAGDSIHVTKVVATQEPALDAAVTIKLGGLAGGHSGVEIGKGRLSGIIGMARLLAYLRDEGITYELASFSGGTANNAIPSGASAVVLVAANDHAALDSAVEAFREKLASEFANIEKNIVLTVSETERPSLVVSPSARDAALEFCTQVINGVYSMSKDMEGLVESSSNLGSFFLDASGLSASTYIRSSVASLFHRLYPRTVKQ